MTHAELDKQILMLLKLKASRVQKRMGLITYYGYPPKRAWSSYPITELTKKNAKPREELFCLPNNLKVYVWYNFDSHIDNMLITTNRPEIILSQHGIDDSLKKKNDAFLEVERLLNEHS